VWMMWEVGGKQAATRPAVVAAFVAQLVLVALRFAWLVFLRARGAWSSPRAFVGYAVLSALVGIASGAIVVTTLPALDPLQRSWLTVCLIGIDSIAVVSMAPSPIVYAGYASWNLGALLWASLVHPIPGFSTVFPVMVVVFIAALAMMMAYVHASLRAQILLGLKLQDAALRDPLTGLRNRRALHEAMTLEIARIERSRSQPGVREDAPRGLAFIVVDVDHFKRINDTHGHAAGDAVLAQLAALLLEATRKVDLVARWGGEEFLVVATGVAEGGAFPLPERIRARVEERLFALPGGKTVHCTCSIGVAPYPPAGADVGPGGSWAHALFEADRALYVAKAQGRNRVVHVADIASIDLAPPCQRIA